MTPVKAQGPTLPVVLLPVPPLDPVVLGPPRLAEVPELPAVGELLEPALVCVPVDAEPEAEVDAELLDGTVRPLPVVLAPVAVPVPALEVARELERALCPGLAPVPCAGPKLSSGSQTPPPQSALVKHGGAPPLHPAQ